MWVISTTWRAAKNIYCYIMFALLDHEGAPRCTGYQFETMDILLLPMTQSFAIQLPTT